MTDIIKKCFSLKQEIRVRSHIINSQPQQEADYMAEEAIRQNRESRIPEISDERLQKLFEQIKPIIRMERIWEVKQGN